MTSDPSILDDRYELGPVLGRGGMADVLLADDRLLGRSVAVKLLRDGDGIDRERFASEARMLAMLNHPNVVAVLDAGVDHDRPWLVLELVEGTPMDELLRSGQVAPARIAVIGAQVAEALAHAHARGIVHRDVKPANVLVAPTDHAKLTDFGIARLTASASVTLTGHTIGTAAYLAPEQVGGDSVSTAADVYALGLVLLEALTGRREYDGPAVEAAFSRLHRSPTVPASLPTGWPSLITTMTTRVPTERPTAAEVAARLVFLSGRAPAAAAVISPPTEQVSFTAPGGLRRRRGGLVVAALLAALLSTAFAITAGIGYRGPAPTAGSSDAGVTTSQPKPRAATRSPTVASAPPPVATAVQPTTVTSVKVRRRGSTTRQQATGKAKRSKARKHRPGRGKRKHGKKR
ncbi:MAG: protein kinase [Nocardioides sp.]|uniref:serine/threonine-protein kinase n=1 Tax=Nocardioides sp. TaxID=35761 RepID=UPI00326436B2